MTDKKNKENLQVIHFDPDDFYSTMLDLVLYNFGLKLAGSARDLETSKFLIAKIMNKSLKPDIAVIESHMGKSEYDGDKIATKLRELVPGIKIIGFSTYETKQWADFEALKTLKESDKSIIKALEEATKIQFKGSDMNDPSD